MCGIAGIIGELNEDNRAALRRMSAALAHRGPDGEGYWEASPDERAWGAMFAHRRLSILDLSPAAAQPMRDEAGGRVVTFNGEIYNFAELRERIGAGGPALRSTGDTAVMLRAFGVLGREAVAQLRGMFAFGLWEPETRELVLARDPLGIKPLYLARSRDPRARWAVAFASEVRALLASGLLGVPRLNPRAAAMVVWNGFVLGPETAIVGIEELGPGELRVYDGAGNEKRSEFYWRYPRVAGTARTEDVLARALEESVRVHLASDVPLGVFLSGGVDSSAIANLARKASRAPVHTFTLGFEEREFDESAVARRVAEAIGTRHREVVLSEQRFVEQLESALDSLDQPTFDGLNSYYMARAVREAGFKVALVGTGGDELFGGYASFRDLPRARRWLRRLAWLPRGARLALSRAVAAAIQARAGAIPIQTRWAKLGEMLAGGDDLVSLYQLAYALFLPCFQEELLQPGVRDSLIEGLPPELRARLVAEAQGRSELATLSVLEQRLFLGERLLRDTDAASMAVSLEVRLPLVDPVLIETVCGLEDAHRYLPVGRKAILRRTALRGLDPAFFERPKAGFEMPFERWMRKSLRRVMDEVLRDSGAVGATGLSADGVRRLWEAFLAGAPGVYWTRVWAIFAFIRWCHRHGAFA